MILQAKILDWENPDLVVITGDMVSGYSWNGQENWYQQFHKMYISPMKERSIP